MRTRMIAESEKLQGIESPLLSRAPQVVAHPREPSQPVLAAPVTRDTMLSYVSKALQYLESLIPSLSGYKQPTAREWESIATSLASLESTLSSMTRKARVAARRAHIEQK